MALGDAAEPSRAGRTLAAKVDRKIIEVNCKKSSKHFTLLQVVLDRRRSFNPLRDGKLLKRSWNRARLGHIIADQ